MTIKISVITATWNCIETLPESLNSVANQSYENIETIWVDGGSTDGTKELLAHSYIPERGGYISEPDQGIYDALNKGIEMAKGDVIGFLHADDILANKNVLSKVAKIFENPSVDAVYGDLIYVDKYESSKIVRNWRCGKFSKRKLSRGWMPPHPTLYMRRSIFQKTGFFNLKYKIAADYDYILRVFSNQNLNSVYIPEILVSMRLGGASNSSIANILRKSKEDFQILRSNKIGNIVTLLLKNARKLHQFSPFKQY